MPNTSFINNPSKGLNQDSHSLTTDNLTYSFALNSVIENQWYGNTGIISNEMSNRCSVEFPIGYHVVGFKEIVEQKRTIYFLHNPTTGISQIGEVFDCNYNYGTDKIKDVYCNNCIKAKGEEMTPLEKQTEQCSCMYRIILSSDCLNFDINHPVDIEYKITNCSLNLYFTDNINERRFIYFDYLNNDPTKELVLQDRFKIIDSYTDDDCLVPIYANELDCEKIKVHPNYSRMCPKFISFVNGGNLKAGTYQILVAYSDIYGNPMSSYFPSTQIVPLFEKEITFETNYETNQALHFRVDNIHIDSIFKYYNVVIAQTVDNFTEFIHVATLPVTQKEYVYTGFEKTLKRLDPVEVLFERPYYKNARGVTKANNYLFYIGVEEYPILNLQPVANSIKLQWQTVALTEKAYRDPKNSFYYRTFQRDEVYALGIIFEFDNGRETCAFHIPGREPNETDLTIVEESDDIITEEACEDLTYCNRGEGEEKYTWEVYNTATVTGTPHEYSEDCDTGCWEYGDFAYWESTERYPKVPEIWGDLCGKCIRHHKFPDSCITHIHDGLDGNKTYKENNYIFPIGIKVDHVSVINALNQTVANNLITQEQRDSIKSYRIVRANRVGQKSIVAKGLIYNMMQDDSKPDDTYYFPNYPYNDIRISSGEDAFLEEVEIAPKTMFTFHSPDTHFVNPSLGNILKIETEEYGEAEGYFTHSECQAKYGLISDFAYTLAFGLGLAAAISATGQKSCKTITYKGDRIDSTPQWTLTDGNGTNTAIPWLQNTVNQDINNYGIYDSETGLPDGFVQAAEETITTCTGESFQIFANLAGPFGAFFGGLNSIIQRTILGIFEMNKILDTMKSLIKDINLSAQYNSVGTYNNYKCVEAGNKVRQIIKSAYLTPHILNVDEPSSLPDGTFDTIKINNWNRESSVYLKLNSILSDTTEADESKNAIRDIFSDSDDIDTEVLDNIFYSPISSYYASIKNNILNQYGQLCDIEYLETTGCSFIIDKEYEECDTVVFGGDTFINRFAIKRKHPFFVQTRCEAPDNSDVLYSELSNTGVVKYYFNTPEPLLSRIEGTSWSDFDWGSLITTLTSANDDNFDIKNNKFLQKKGLITLFSYGIPYFLVESDINVDYRTGQNRTDKDFYPHNTDLKEWLEEKNVPISTDNTFYYNRTYSKQNKESTICSSCILDPRDLICDSTNYNRLIYSDPSISENNSDNWLVFKANNYYDFDLTKGKLISADGIENDKVLVRLEQGTQIFNAYDTIQASSTTIQVGTGGMFTSRPQDIAITDLGYAGSQHRDILHTEFGHIWGDAKRGDIFKLGTGGGGIEVISNNGMKSWFKEHLPFNILKYFPNINIDNNLNGIGLHYGYDRRFNRILITKLDYNPIVDGITYSNNKFYYNEEEIQLWNPKFFCNKSWTLSYNFYNNSWTSFHSYTPLFYVEHIDNFDSSVRQLSTNNGNLTFKQKNYTHNTTNKSYQVFYGKLEPFIIETHGKQDINTNTLNSVEYYCEAVRYHNDFDYFYNSNKTFNKIIIYNDYQTSGLLNLIVSDPNNFNQRYSYPKVTPNGLEILTTNSENKWRINTFYNVAVDVSNNVPIFLYDCNHVNKTLNKRAINYNIKDLNKELLRSRMHKVRYIQDIESNYKFNFIFGQLNQRQSFR